MSCTKHEGLMKENLKSKTIKGVAWATADKYLTQLFSFVIGIVMARILSVSDYGFVAIATSVTAVFKLLVEGGFSAALIQRNSDDEEENSTIQLSMLALAIILFIVLFSLSPLVAKIYDNNDLTLLIRIYGLYLPIDAMKVFYESLIKKQLDFKKIFIASLTGTIFGGTVGIILALTGYGMWALITYMMLDAFIDCICMHMLSRWKVKRLFSIQKLKQIFKYSVYDLMYNALNQYSNQFIELTLGASVSVEQLSLFNRGKQYPYILSDAVDGAMANVFFPVLSQINDDATFKNAVRRMVKTSTYLMLPVLIGFALVAEPLVRILLTDKWIECVPYLKITCITYTLCTYNTCFIKALYAKNLVNKTLKIEILTTALRLAIEIYAMTISVKAFVWSIFIVWLVKAILNMIACCNAINYSFVEVIWDVGQNYICVALMSFVVYIISLAKLNDFILLAFEIVAGMISYVTVSLILKNESFMYLIDMIKGRKNGKTKNK